VYAGPTAAGRWFTAAFAVTGVPILNRRIFYFRVFESD